MVMIFRFKAMNKINQFFRTLYTRPGLMWKFGAGFIFVIHGFGAAVCTEVDLWLGRRH
jgi:hypothetical protein